MARETQQGQGRQTGTQQQTGSTQQTSSTTDVHGTESGRSDQERSIATGREQRQPKRGDLARRSEQGNLRENIGGGLTAEPFRVMQRMAQDMDELFGHLGFGRPWTGLSLNPMLTGGLGRTLPADLVTSADLRFPTVETFQSGDKFVIRADLPGVKKDDIQVEVENDILTICGERQEENEQDREGFYRTERTYGEFYRAIPLPESADTEHVDTSFKDGVLEIKVPAPKQAEHNRRRIEIR